MANVDHHDRTEAIYLKNGEVNVEIVSGKHNFHITVTKSKCLTIYHVNLLL